MTRAEIAAIADDLARHFAEQGKLIEAGWVAFRAMTVPTDASEVQIREMRFAFMAGAQHLWGSVMGSILDPGEEPSEGDMARFQKIADELDAFTKDMKLRYKPGGRA